MPDETPSTAIPTDTAEWRAALADIGVVVRAALSGIDEMPSFDIGRTDYGFREPRTLARAVSAIAEYAAARASSAALPKIVEQAKADERERISMLLNRGHPIYLR